MNAVAAPKNAMSHIQKTDPGPPMAMAVATPTMLPVPMRPERAMQKASKDEMPLPLPALTANSDLSISLIWRTCTKRVPAVKNRPANIRSPTSAGLQINLLICDTTSAKLMFRNIVIFRQDYKRSRRQRQSGSWQQEVNPKKKKGGR